MHASSCIILVWHSNTSVHTTTIIALFNMNEFSNYIIRRTALEAQLASVAVEAGSVAAAGP